jgi:integrase/recombinase XerD
MNYIDAMNDFFNYLLEINRSDKTVNTYRKTLTRYYKYLCELKNREIYIKDINSDDFEKYLLEEFNGLSDSSKHSSITSFKSFLSYCFNRGLCDVNVSRQISQIRCRIKEKVSINEEEFQRLVDNIDNLVVKTVVYTMFYTGCRIGELVKLKVDDVDLVKNCVNVRKPKGHSQSSRVIPINYKLKNILLEYLSIRLGGETEDSFFVLKRSGRISEDTVNRAIKDAGKKAGINKSISNHILRHTFASLLVEKGIDLKRVQTLLGHSNLEVTSIYLHSNPMRLREAVNLLK